jgi:ribosomal protein L3 glutamine methyltransferase
MGVRLIDAVDQAAARLDAAGVSFGHGTLNAFDEAAWLVLWRLGLPLDALEANETVQLTIEQQQSIDVLLQQRISTRQPAAYLTGEAWLHGVPFDIDARSIVPRSLIAEPLLDGSLDAWCTQAPQRVLDLCTGNGSLAVLAALVWPDATVDASDVSVDALQVAQRNVQRHGLGTRIQLHQGDGLAGVPLDARFDVVLCNPPYVNAASMASLPAEFQAEPALALAGGLDGMDFIRQCLPALAPRMAEEGILVLEIGHEIDHFEAAFPGLQAVWLPTSGGDTNVALLTRDALQAHFAPSSNRR